MFELCFLNSNMKDYYFLVRQNQKMHQNQIDNLDHFLKNLSQRCGCLQQFKSRIIMKNLSQASMNEISKRKFYVNCCCCWSIIFLVSLTVLVIDYSLSASDCNQRLTFYSSLKDHTMVRCQEVCWGRLVQSSDQLSCCTLNAAVCNSKSECLSRLIKALEHRSMTNIEALVALSISIILLIPLSFYFCWKQEKTIRTLKQFSQMNLNSDDILLEDNPEESLKIKKRYQQKKLKSHLFQSFLHEDQDNTCCICLEGFQNQKVIRLQCGHLFHSFCIRRWTTVRTTCPICRRV